MASTLKWIKIIMEILRIILNGTSREDAVKMAADKYGVSESEIWEHGGF